MNSSRLDLLPLPRRRALRRAYLMRLMAVVAVMGTILGAVAFALLIPTYTYLLSAETAAKARLADVEAHISTEGESELGKQLALLEADAATVAALSTSTPASTVLKTVLAISRPGVVLSDFEYAPAGGGRAGVLTLSGVAATRNDLRAYQLALAASPAFTDANLPVSSYAKDQNLPFIITVTLATSTAAGTGTSPAP